MNISTDTKRLFVLFSSISLSLLLIAVLTTGSVNAFENATEYKFVKKWGGAGSGNGQFLRPHDLDFNKEETVLYIVDRDGSRIQAFDSKGKFILKFGNVDGVPSAEEGKFDNPRHVAVSKDLKYVFVADSKNNRISQFDTKGNYIKSIGQLGTKPGDFNLPTTIEIDSKGNFFVNERGNERIQKFDSNWKPILMWGSKGSGDNQFCHMEHIALDKYDNVYVTDPQSDPGCSQQPRVLKFDSNGKFIIKWGSFGKGDGQFLDPEHLAVDSEGNVYISDRKRDDIQKFSPISETGDQSIGSMSNNVLSSQVEPSKKTNTNVLLDIAPKPSNTTKTIDAKAWDNLMKQK